MEHPAYQILEDAKQELIDWVKEKALPIHKVDYVSAFEEWNDSLGVWVFYDTDLSLKESNANGVSSRVKDKYQEILTMHSYPFSEFPKISFEFDSHENVMKNYEGSYFYRLR